MTMGNELHIRDLEFVRNRLVNAPKIDVFGQMI